MAKETMIVFIYDTECLKNETDDPIDAVLYFHPYWVSDAQKIALCGQLMGTTHFLKNCFFKPRIIALQNGKFVLKEFGHLILFVGSDCNISETLLLNRADLLVNLIKLFHHNLQNICKDTTDNAKKNVKDKLHKIFDTYLPILQTNANFLNNIRKLRIAKAANNVFLDAIQTLQSCQQSKGILGGAILYNGKIISSQLNDTLAKHLVLVDINGLRAIGEELQSSSFHVPNGVHVFNIYIKKSEYEILCKEAERVQNLQTTKLSGGFLTFQCLKRKMKRDKSLIFTNIPEELDAAANNEKTTNETKPPQRPNSLLICPSHSTIRSKKVNCTKEIQETNKKQHINFDESDSYPEFIGRTSVCSTPLTENKIFHVKNKMSICANPEDNINSNIKQNTTTTARNKFDFEKFLQHIFPMKKSNSFANIQDTLKRHNLKEILNKTDENLNNGGELDEKEIQELLSNNLFQEFYEKYKLQTTNNEFMNNMEITNFIQNFKEYEMGLKKFQPSSTTTNNRTTDRNLNDIEEIPAKTTTIPLTPLIAKLSVLAMHDKHTSTQNIETPITYTVKPQKLVTNKTAQIPEENQQMKINVKQMDEELQRIELFICVQQNMILLQLMAEGTYNKQNVIQRMFDICVAKFPNMKTRLNQMLAINVAGEKYEDGYSLISVNGNWDAMEGNGTWSTNDINILEYLHCDLQKNHSITDLMIRSSDSVFYGFRSGRQNFYYKEMANNIVHMPPFSDPISNIDMRAKKRIEQNYSSMP